jgi:hypothetical protein
MAILVRHLFDPAVTRKFRSQRRHVERSKSDGLGSTDDAELAVDELLAAAEGVHAAAGAAPAPSNSSSTDTAGTTTRSSSSSSGGGGAADTAGATTTTTAPHSTRATTTGGASNSVASSTTTTNVASVMARTASTSLDLDRQLELEARMQGGAPAASAVSVASSVSSSSGATSTTGNTTTGAGGGGRGGGGGGGGGGSASMSGTDYTIDDFLQWEAQAEAEADARAQMEAEAEAQAEVQARGQSGAQHLPASEIHTRVVDGKATRFEAAAFVSEIEAWEFTRPPATTTGGCVTAAEIKAQVDDDISRKANHTTFDLPGYHGKGTEREWHAVFCQQIVHHMAAGHLPSDNVRAHYVLATVNESDKTVDEWSERVGSVAAAPPPPDFVLKWDGVRNHLRGRWTVMGSAEYGIPSETVLLAETGPHAMAAQYRDGGVDSSANVTTPEHSGQQTWLYVLLCFRLLYDL